MGEVVAKRRPEYARLKEMQASLPSYRHLLTGEVRTVDVDRMRQWVAYPEGGAAGAVDERPYLAVRDAVITCRFPVAEVGAVGLIDLPGLGELVPDAEEHHLAGLENDVDFVIVVKRPDQTNAPVEDRGPGGARPDRARGWGRVDPRLHDHPDQHRGL